MSGDIKKKYKCPFCKKGIMTYNKNLAGGINCDDEPVYKCNKCKEELELDDDNIDTLEEVKN